MQASGGVAVELIEHTALIEHALIELRPQSVASVEVGARLETWLSDHIDAFGVAKIDDPGSADLVISGASDYASVRRLLDVAGTRPAALIVGGTGWPCGRRDALTSVGQFDNHQRARFAYRAPVPGQQSLGSEPAPLAFAIEEGGPENGVLTAVEDACRDASGVWDMKLVAGFGGVALLLPTALATAERWETILPDDLIERIMGQLELANDQLRLDRLRLLRERDAAVSASRSGVPLAELGQVAREITARANADVESRRRLEQRLVGVVEEAEEVVDRERRRSLGLEQSLAAEQAALAAERATTARLEQRVTEVSAALEDANRSLEEQRAFVLRQAQLIADSHAWRLGHGVASLGRRLTFRPTRGTDAVQRLQERLTASALLLPAGPPEVPAPPPEVPAPPPEVPPPPPEAPPTTTVDAPAASP